MDFVFRQVDVFAETAFKGNPLAVVHGADALSDAEMASFANWTNLSETTFLMAPRVEGADYRVRIFTPRGELPFAGHPTLGSCHAWLEEGGRPAADDVVQECGVGLVRVRREAGRLAFAAPKLRRSGAIEPALLARITAGLGVAQDAILASNWIDNGAGWIGLMIRTRAELLALRPDFGALAGLDVGVVAPCDAARDGIDTAFEVRGFAPGAGIDEDPVTGSLNAGLAQWLMGAGLAPDRYVASQGTCLGRAGRVHVARDGDDIWIGGTSTTRIAGRVTF